METANSPQPRWRAPTAAPARTPSRSARRTVTRPGSRPFPAQAARGRCRTGSRIVPPCSWQAHRRHGLRRQPFAPPRKAQAFRRRRLDADARDIEVENLGDLRAHRIAVRPNLRPLADDCDIAMGDRASLATHQTRRVIEEFPRRRAAPAFVRRRKMLTDVAFADGSPRSRLSTACKPASASEWPSRRVIVRDFHAAQPNMIARHEAMDVIAGSGARIV